MDKPAPTQSLPSKKTPSRADSRAGGGAPFSENPAWRTVGAGWQRVFGSFKGLGYSIEWHDFYAAREFDWGASFHPGGVELCLNLKGNGFVEEAGRREEFAPVTTGF